jgi:mRNA-degrading endonuclease HigB of HigAB toxin-antitoxin module
MDVLGTEKIHTLSLKYPESLAILSELVRDLEAQTIRNVAALSERYQTCEMVDSRTVRLNISDGRWRVTARISFNSQKLVIIDADAHPEYERYRGA